MKIRCLLAMGGCLASVVGMTGCDRGSGPGGMPMMGGLPGMNAAPAEVGIVTVSSEQVSVTTDLPGRVNAERLAEVRARVTGILLRRLFEEGGDVAVNQVLFEIDPAPLQASYDSAKANLAKAEVTLAQALAKAKRNEALVKINGVSQQVYEDAKVGAAQGEAEVLAAKAALEMASLNLGYTKVTAPIAGRIGKALISEGALASASEATRMAVIQQLDPVYVDFSQSSSEWASFRRAIEAQNPSWLSNGAVSVTLLLEDGSVYEETGKLVFADASVDESTSCIALRAQFPNPKKLLLPGMFVRGRIPKPATTRAITVPQRAVSRDAAGQASVLIVNAQNQVERRDIRTGEASGDRWIVSDGLAAGERVIVEGLQRARAGATVKPVAFLTDSTTTK